MPVLTKVLVKGHLMDESEDTENLANLSSMQKQLYYLLMRTKLISSLPDQILDSKILLCGLILLPNCHAEKLTPHESKSSLYSII